MDASADPWTLDLPELLLPGPNRLMRMNRHEYRRYRDELLLRARAALSAPPPARPLEACAVTLELVRPRRSLLDADAKYGAVKPLLDVLQPDRAYARTIGGYRVRDAVHGIGLIRDDGDGEGDLDGCVRRLRVLQRCGPAHVRAWVWDWPSAPA